MENNEIGFEYRLESVLKKSINGESLVSLDRKIRKASNNYEAKMMYEDECRKFLRIITKNAGHTSKIEVNKDSGKKFMEFSLVMPYHEGKTMHVFGRVLIENETEEE